MSKEKPDREVTVPVEIVRPDPHWQRAVASIGFFWLRAWFVMLVLPVAFPHTHLGFWQVCALLGIFTWLMSDQSTTAFTRMRGVRK